MSHATIVARFVRDAGKSDARFLAPRSANVYVSPDGRSLYSYGSHFTLARLMPAASVSRPGGDGFDAPDGWWLVNGDTASISTSRHQSIVRDAIRHDGRPSMIVSFDAMRSAGIELETITPVHVLDDREIQVPRTGRELPSEVAREYVRTDVPAVCLFADCDGVSTWGGGAFPCVHRLDRETRVYRDTPERWTYDETAGLYRWTTSRHVLGEAVFSANVETVRTDGDGRRVRMTYSASFLSAFDHQETHLHYFLAELPAGAGPWGRDHLRVRTVDDALRALRPTEVRRADADGVPVVRQGDVFAVPRPDVTDAALKANGYTRTRSGRLLGGSSHVATEVAVSADGTRTYARGILHHRPEGFRARTDPNHRRQTMGDRRTWHLIVRNTVPRADIGATGRDGDTSPRSWTRGGNVD